MKRQGWKLEDGFFEPSDISKKEANQQNSKWQVYAKYINPLNPKIKIWILIYCRYSFPTKVVGRSW